MLKRLKDMLANAEHELIFLENRLLEKQVNFEFNPSGGNEYVLKMGKESLAEKANYINFLRARIQHLETGVSVPTPILLTAETVQSSLQF